MKERLKVLVKKHCYKIIMAVIFIVIFTIFLLIVKWQLENFYNKHYNKLIEDYYSSEEALNDTNIRKNDINSFDMYSDASSTEDADDEVAEATVHGVDSIIRVPSLNVVLPICKGNFTEDVENFKLSVYSTNMHLGETSYSVLGHHAIQLRIAFGWLEDVELGTQIDFERHGTNYSYYVTDIKIDYASEVSEVFSVTEQNVVYLATCDYSRGKSERTVYRVVKCEPIS